MSNLLEKASIVTTPTAYDNGKILSVKPAPSLGSELITNGGFDTDSGWNKQTSNWTIVNGYAVCDGLQTSNSSLFQDVAVINGKSYRIDFTITNSVNNLNLILGATTIGQYGSGTHSIYVTKDANASARIFFQATASNNFSGSIDNVSVKQEIDGDFDFTRNSSATRVNSEGLIEDITSNLPRIDYTGGTGHWLFEPQSTNLITYSEDYSNSFYVKDSGVSVGTTNNLSPSINANATKIDVTNNGRIYANIATNTYYTTVFIKSGTFSHFKFAGSNIDLIAETNSNGTIQSFGNGWYRIGKSYTGNRPFQIQAYPDGTYSSHTTSGNYFIWGAQAEVQSFATSYIPTSGSTVTRLQDAAFGAGSSDLINSTEGVLYAEVSLNLLTPNMYIQISDGTYSNRVAIINNNSSIGWRVFYRVNGSSQIDVTASGLNTFETNKIAISWKLNEFKFYVNGIKITQVNSGSVNPANTFNRLEFKDIVSNNFYGKTKCVAVFKEALTDEELTCLTTI